MQKRYTFETTAVQYDQSIDATLSDIVIVVSGPRVSSFVASSSVMLGCTLPMVPLPLPRVVIEALPYLHAYST